MGRGLCVLWLCSFVPFDPMIARYNVVNCQELGGGAGPVDYEQTLAGHLDALRSVLAEELSEDLGDWRGWTVRRAWLKQQGTD